MGDDPLYPLIKHATFTPEELNELTPRKLLQYAAENVQRAQNQVKMIADGAQQQIEDLVASCPQLAALPQVRHLREELQKTAKTSDTVYGRVRDVCKAARIDISTETETLPVQQAVTIDSARLEQCEREWASPPATPVSRKRKRRRTKQEALYFQLHGEGTPIRKASVTTSTQTTPELSSPLPRRGRSAKLLNQHDSPEPLTEKMTEKKNKNKSKKGVRKPKERAVTVRDGSEKSE